MPRQSGPKPNFTCKLLILNRMKALSRFAEPFQNLSNHFKIEIEARPSPPAATGELTRYSWRGPPTVHDHSFDTKQRLEAIVTKPMRPSFPNRAIVRFRR